MPKGLVRVCSQTHVRMEDRAARGVAGKCETGVEAEYSPFVGKVGLDMTADTGKASTSWSSRLKTTAVSRGRSSLTALALTATVRKPLTSVGFQLRQ